MSIPHTVILGSGIIGVSTAYYLSQSQPPSSIHLIDPSPIPFSSASGHAGGFLAADWFSPSLASLGALSFSEHRKLAQEYNGAERWGYAESLASSYVPKNALRGERSRDWFKEGRSRAEVAGGAMADMDPKSAGAEMAWLRRREGDRIEVLSEPETTAQVDPKRLCEFLLEQVKERGVRVHQPAEAVSVGLDMRDRLASVRVVDMDGKDEVDIPCTRIIICAGLWTPEVFRTLFPKSTLKLPIRSIAGHSLVVRTPKWTGVSDKPIPEDFGKKGEENEAPCHALFTTDTGKGFAPEVFTRRNGEIYICGLNTREEDSMSLEAPSANGPAKPLEDHIAKLRVVAEQLTGTDELEVVREGLCYRPVTNSGLPIITRVEDEQLGGVKTLKGEDGGVYVVAGHGPWGISLSLGTGKVVSEMVRNVKTSASVKGMGIKEAKRSEM